MFSSADPLSLDGGKMCENELVTGGFRYDLMESQAGFLLAFSVSKSPVAARKDFQN
jgi:hypothetical protein